MNTRVFLVRHAQTLSNATGRYMGWIDEDLSEEGIWQAKQLCHRLEGQTIASAYSSPLKRAYRTAEIIVTPHSLPVLPLQELGEIRIGAWEGLSATEIAAKFPDTWQAWRRDPSNIQMPGGESFAQVQQRAIACFESIVKTNRGLHILVVTHDVIVRMLVSYCLNVSASIYRQLEVANASLTIIHLIKDGQYRLQVLNDTGHLETTLR